MVSFKGKSIATRVTENPRALKNNITLRGFKVYTDLEKMNKSCDEHGVNSLPVKKGVHQTDSTNVLKVYDETSKDEVSVKVKVGRKALADVSNIKNNSARSGVSNGSKAVRTTTKPLIQARKSLPVKRGIFQTDSSDLLKGCDVNSQRSMSKRDSSVKVKSEQKVLGDVSNLGNNLSTTSGSNESKTIKVHSRKSLHLPRAAPGQSTTITSFPVRKIAMGTLKAVHKNCTEGAHILKKVDTRDVKLFPESQKTKGTGHASYGIDGRKIVSKPLVLTRKSLPVFGKTNQIGSSGSEVKEKISERGRGKLVKLKVGRKVVADVSNSRISLWKNRASDSFISAQVKSKRSTLLPRVPVEQNVVDAGGSSGRSAEATATSSKTNEKMLIMVPGTNYNRRQSFTSSLLAKSEVSRGYCDFSKKEKLPSIDNVQNHLEVAEYVEDIYKYYWVMEAQYPSISNYMASQTHITPKMRGILINWLIEVHLKFGLMQETLFLMVTLFDRFLSIVTIERNEMQLVGLTALLLASKYEDFWHPKVNDLISISADSYTRQQMLAMEKLILNKLMFRLNTPTPYVFMLRFLKAAQSDKKLEHLAFYLIELCLVEYDALKYKPSLLCASAIYVARCTLQISPTWSPLLCKHAHYEEPELRECADMILRLHKASGKGQLKVSHEKYLHPDRSSVAEIKALNRLPPR